MTFDHFLTELTEWAPTQAAITGVLLVGSHARGQARPDSDVDVVILSREPQRYLEEICFVGRFGSAVRVEREEWGRVTSLRVWYEDGLEVEFSLTDPGWAALPPDPGTAQVVSGGARLLFDRDGALAALLAAIEPSAQRAPGAEDTERPASPALEPRDRDLIQRQRSSLRPDCGKSLFS